MLHDSLPLRLRCGQVPFKPQLIFLRPDPEKNFFLKKSNCYPFLTHQRPLQLEDCSRSKTVLGCHFPSQAPSTKYVWRTLFPMELPANEGREFPAFRVTTDLPLWAKKEIKVVQSAMMQNLTKMQRHLDIVSMNLYKIRLMICKFRIYIKIYNHKRLPDWPMPTSAAAPAEGAALLRGRTSLLLRWTWYTFSAGTQDRGLSSGGMVTPYSQPVECTGTQKQIKKKFRHAFLDKFWCLQTWRWGDVMRFSAPWSSTALLSSTVHSSSHIQPGGQSNSPGLRLFSPFCTT